MGEFVNLLNAAGTAFVALSVRVLVQSSVLILALLILDCALRKRVKAVVRYWVWLLVLAKLVLPPSLSSPTSLAWWIGDKLPGGDARLCVSAEDAAGERMIEIPVSVPMSQAVLHETARMPAAADPAAPVRLHEAMSPAQAVAPVAVPTWQALALASWLAAVGVMLVLLVQRALFVRGLVLQSQEAPERMLDLLGRCRRQMGVRTPVRLRLMSVSVSPSVCGLVWPTILVPQRMLARLDSGQLKSILLHELAHVRRADLWVNLAQTLLQIVYVYHPLVWLANAIIRKVREQAVDETVLAAMGDEAEEYPRTLLSVSKLAFDHPALSLRLVGVVESKRMLAARIRHIVSRPFPTSARLGLAGVVLVLAVGAVLLPMAKARHNVETAAESVATTLPVATTTEPGVAYPQTAPAPVGAVVDEKGNPVPGARILLYHRMNAWGLNNRVVEQTRTNAQGRFALTEPLTYENNNDCTYTDHFLLFATHPDHAMAWHVILASKVKAEYRLTMTEPVTQAFRITDREGQPLANARVWICAAGRNDDTSPLLRPYFGIPDDIGLLTATTDGQGRATLGNLPHTDCSFRASLPSYSHRYVSVGVPPQGETHVEMTRAGTVTGHVLTADGKPVGGAEVWFQADWGEWYFDYAVTDETGRFLNDRMVARGGSWVKSGGSGQYKVIVRHPEFIAPETVVQLEPGQTDTFGIEAVPGTLLRIRVLEPETERPLPGVRVEGSSAGGRIDGYTDANGVFERQVLNGEASVSFSSPPGGTYVVEDTTRSSPRITAEGGIKEVTLYAPSRLHPLVDIKGRLTLPDGSPARGLKISTTNNISGYNTATFGGTGSASARANPDGTFDLKEVPRDAEVFLYAETSDHQHVLAEVLDPAQASPELARPLVMREGATASILLTDASGKPRVNTALKLRPRKWEHYVFRADDRPASTDAEGRLILDGIVPGLEYFIRDARANLGENGWWDLYNENRVLLPLDAGASVPTTPSPASEVTGTTISGVVVDSAGKPIPDAYVTLENLDLLLLPEPVRIESQTRRVMRANGTQTNAQGEFRFTDLVPGKTGISARAHGYRTEYARNIATGTEGLRIVLGEPRLYRLSGNVVDTSCKGIEGVEVTFIEETLSGPGNGSDTPSLTLRTDSAGAFRIDKILSPADRQSSRRLLLARKEGYGAWGQELDTTGGQTSLHITLQAEEKVSGVVQDETSRPVAGAAVILNSGRGSYGNFWFPPAWLHLAPRATTQADGSFTLGQLPTESDLSLRVEAQGYASGELLPIRTGRFGSYGIRRGEGMMVMGKITDPNAPLVITLQKAVTLRGAVVYEGTGAPAQAIRVATQAQRGGTWSETTTDTTGRFEMTGVSPVPCNLLVMADSPARDTAPEWTAAAIRLNDLQPGETRDGLMLVLTKGDTVRGRVTDAQGQPLQGIDIAFYSAARPRPGGACQSILTAADGTWAYRFPPGEVYIYIRERLSGAGWNRSTYTYNLNAGQTIEGVDFMLNKAVADDSRYRGAAAGEDGTFALPAGATPGPVTPWPASQGGNDHFYQPIRMPKPLPWAEANRIARALGGYLVTITSEAENDFVFRLIDNDTYWFHSFNWRGPWIGALQPAGSEEPGGGWSWVTGEPFTYARWDAGQPNNFNGTPENRLVFGNQRNRIPTWNDVLEDFPEVVSFLVEWDGSPSAD